MRVTEDTQPSLLTVIMSRAFHVGCRGSVSSATVLKEDREQGWTTIGRIYICVAICYMLCSVSCIHAASDLDLFTDIGPVEAARRVREQIGDTPTIVR